jgi:uncharacterized protein (TIRG00374 family)
MPSLRPFSFLSEERLDRTVDEINHGLGGLRHPRIALEAFVWTIAAWMLSALCAYIVSLAFRLQLSFACGVLVVVAVGLGMIVPSSPGAIGVFEAAALIALKPFGISHSVALSYALVLHAVNSFRFYSLVFRYCSTTPTPRRGNESSATAASRRFPHSRQRSWG